jgi:hypothetical protein
LNLKIRKLKLATFKKVRLSGGTWNGHWVEVKTLPGWVQPFVILPRKITFEESQSLLICSTIAHKPPEDVYERNDTGEFIFTGIHDYKPDGKAFVSIESSNA